MALSTTLAMHIKRNVTLARPRRYPSAAAMLLQPRRVPEEVYRNVLTIIHDEGAPHIRRLIGLRPDGLIHWSQDTGAGEGAGHGHVDAATNLPLDTCAV